jgi:hypothetical protein
VTDGLPTEDYPTKPPDPSNQRKPTCSPCSLTPS